MLSNRHRKFRSGRGMSSSQPERHWFRTLGGSAALLILGTGSGCLPSINHGPRVEEGSSGGIVASVTPGPRYDHGEYTSPYLYGPVGVSFGRGWAAKDENAIGVYLGGHIPVPGIFFAQADLYLQAPGSVVGDLNGGIGINAGYASYSPYLQFGRIDAQGSGWYTTQGVTLLPARARYADNELYGWMWIGSVAHQWSDAGRERRVFLSGGVGAHNGSCHHSCWPAERRYVLAAGLSVDLYRGAADQRRDRN
jgi:hypothetical protein